MPLQIFKKQQRSPPVERVKELSSHGFSEPEIIDVLRKEGYTPQEIDIALTQALKEKLEPPSMILEQKKEEKTQSIEEIAKRLQPEQQTIPQIQQPQFQQQYTWEDYFNYIDYLIHSRISEVNKELEKFNFKYQNLEKRIEEINQIIRHSSMTKEEAYSQILRKIEELKPSINEISQRISVLEELLKEILPALIDSVRSLTKLAQNK